MLENDSNSQKKKAVTAPVVHNARLYFTAMTWAALIISTAVAIINTTDADYFYLIPVGVYALFLSFFRYLNYVPGRGWVKAERWSIWKRTSGESELSRRVLFIGIGFLLIFWMNFYSVSFVSMYFVLLGYTMGLLAWRASIPVAAMEMFVLLLQNSRLGVEGLISISISIIFAFFNIIVIVALINSRQKSEALVQELKETQAKLQEAHSQEKELAVFRERDRMAREMHDVLGHALVLVAVKIEASQRLQAVDPARAAAELNATKELVRQSMADLRTSLAELRSSALEAADKPMTQALGEWAALTAKEGKFTFQSSFEPGIEDIPAPIQDALWRVGREALLNVVKHAQARQVELNVFCKDNTVFLSVGDDGTGIPLLAENQARLEVEGHYGIRGMRERLELLGGKLLVRPGREGRGTLILASIPLPPASAPPAIRPDKSFSSLKSWLFNSGR